MVVTVVVCGVGVVAAAVAPPPPLAPLASADPLLPELLPGIWLVVVVVTPALAFVRLAFAAVSADWAASTCCWAAVVSTVASTSPLVTVSPTATLRAVSFPPVVKS